MKQILFFTWALYALVAPLYAEGTLSEDVAYQKLMKEIQTHPICNEESFSLMAYDTVIRYKLRGDCTAQIQIPISKREGYIEIKGKDLKQMTQEALERFKALRQRIGLWGREHALDRSFDQRDAAGYHDCGASSLFSVVGIEKIGRKPEWINPYLNADKHFDCFGKDLIEGCKASKMTMMSYMGAQMDMTFKIKQEQGKCTLTYHIPLPSTKTEGVMRKNWWHSTKKPQKLPTSEILEGKFADIHGFINDKNNHMNIDAGYFEKEIGSKAENRGAYAYFMLFVQPWMYYLSGL